MSGTTAGACSPWPTTIVSGGEVGDRLTAELARYLFDAGLNPITQRLGKRPASERFDPTTAFYVEAAQYTVGVTRDELPSAVHRAPHAMRALRVDGLQLDEGWLVFVRRGGPLLHLPELLRTEDCRLHLMVVDLAPAAELAHQPEPTITVPAAELRAGLAATRSRWPTSP